MFKEYKPGVTVTFELSEFSGATLTGTIRYISQVRGLPKPFVVEFTAPDGVSTHVANLRKNDLKIV